MSELRQLTTDQQRQWFFSAKEHGGLCAACGRALDDGEVVYIEPVDVMPGPGAIWSRRKTSRAAHLGQECVSPEFLARASLLPIERCEGCARPVFHAVERAARMHTFCSKRCLNRVMTRSRQAERREKGARE
jgi:hypothetical protein